MHRSIMAAAAVLLAIGKGAAQVRTIDPNQGIDRDLSSSQQPASQSASHLAVPGRRQPDPIPVQSDQAQPDQTQPEQAQSDQVPPGQAPPDQGPIYQGSTYQTPGDAARAGDQARADATMQAADTYKRDDLIAAGEGVFGKGAEGLAGIIERILKDQGQPNAYIAGREASGAFVVGLRYGSGVLSHKIEGQQPVYWTGPSVGFDVGGDANKVFVLVYNLYDTADLYHRFPGAEGRLYFVGGFAATYLRRGNIVVIPIRLGVGWRAGVNVNYMKFSHRSKILPF